MAKDWQKMLDTLSGSNHSSTPYNASSSSGSSAKSSSSSKPSSSASRAGSSSGSSNDWQGMLSEISGSRKSDNDTKRSNTGSSVSSRVITRATKKDEEEEEEKRGWFQKGALKDGITVGTISKAILGTLSDAAEDFTTGFVGAPEAIWKGLARVAPDIANAQFYQNGAIYDLETEKAHKEAIEESRKQMNEYANRDYYDQKNIAKHILSSLSAGAYLSNNAEVGKIATAEDLALSRELQGVSRNYLDNEMESQSVFSEKVDSTVESLGQNMFTKALGGVGVPWQVTTGLSVLGSESQQAEEDGATEEEAKTSALISAGGEILSEYLFGGVFGEVGLDDKIIKNFSRTVSNKFVRNLLKAGVKSTGEGFEEAFSFGVGTLGKYLTYADEKTLKELFTSEEALDELATNFVSGMLSGGVFNTADAIATNASGVDYTTGLTKNEQKVVDKLYKDEIAKKEGKVTQREKNKLYDSIVEEMEKGYISVDDIVEALGGEKYNQYKQAADWESSLQTEYDTLSKEYDDLYNMEGGKKSSKMTDREAELKEMLPGLKTRLDNVLATSTVGQQKAQLTKDVYEMSKSDRLVESFFENVRANQKFEADLSKYEGRARDVIKQVMDSGLADNTNQSHEFWDMIANMAVDRDTNVSLVDNDQMMELVKKDIEASGKTFDASKFEGKIIDGIITDDGIAINAKTKRAFNFVIGHEITHSLEMNKSYGDLQKILFKYAQDEYKTRFEQRAGQYEGVYSEDNYKAKIDREVTADMVGDFLFTDKDFVKHLSTENRNVFQKVWDEVKYLSKVATAGSKQARELERVKKVFEQVWRENATVKDGVESRYSLEKTGKSKYNKRSRYSETETLFMSWENGSAPVGDVKKFNRFGKLRYYEKTENGCVELSRSQYNERKGVYAEDIDRRAEHRIGTAHDYDESSERGSSGYHNGYRDSRGNAPVFGQAIREKLRHDTTGSSASTDGHSSRNSITQTEHTNNEASDESGASFITFSNDYATIRNFMKEEDSGSRYSLSEDSDGRKLSPAVSKRFGNSKVIDENGNLKAVYHGTASGEFFIFDKAKGSVEGDFGSGFYFTDNEADVSEHYEGGGPDFENKVAMLAEQIEADEDIDYEEAKERARAELYKGSHKFEVYLNIENPAVVGETMLFDGESYLEQYNEEDYDDYDDYIADVEQQVADDIENIVWEVEKNVDVYSVDGLADVLFEAYYDGGIGIEELKAKINNLYLEDSNGNLVGNEVARQIIESLGYDGIIDPTVAGKWNMDIEDGTTHYIVFKPNQIKAITNQNPTDNPDIRKSISDVGQEHKQYGNWNVYAKDILLNKDDIAPVAENATVSETESVQDAPIYESNDKSAPEGQTAMFEPVEEEKKQTRKEYHQSIIDNIKSIFRGEGFDFDKVLKDAKNLSTWSTVDNTPQRVMEKALGYKQGGILADITVNKVAQNETEGIKWLNAYVDQLKQISKQYGIKPGSKESATAQMFAEGFFVNENNEIIRYGEPELIQDFGNADVRRRIKGLARDPRIRKIYDDTLANINASRARNLYPEIPRLDNYFLHFRAMEDTFSTLGLPFNPNDIRAKDLPTDLNGVTADLKPGQPYFASANHRTGKRTSFDLLGGLERYLNSAKNQIYHIDDIQTLRALRNYIAETYGQATGLEDIDSMTDAEAEERIKQVYDSHLSTFAKFLNEEANVLAGKTALIDRGIEGIIGRRGITFLNALNKQVGSNMVGYNVSSSLTNFLPVVQTFAKTNKFDFTKAFTQTVANKLTGGRFDSFAEDSPVVIRRKGEDRFYRTLWQKMADPGYALMGMVDDISTEIIARTKYNELTRKGMDSQKAHFETDKWVSRLMGDRSLGQQPQLYNSKMLGLVTKFQLEVRNQLDSQFYDTIQETKVSNEHIQNGLARNAKTAAKVASVFTQLAVAQHLYGMAFESMAGYNPAFDIIEVLMTAFGFDDEEDSEDTLKDNLGQGFEALMEDLPYASIVTGGGRIPISSALPIKEFFKGEDQYGNEKNRWETLGEVAPYYLMPGGYGQAKKTYQGLKMFSDDHPIAGSYTDAGNLRYDVEDTVGSRIKAGIFGQYASENAQKYFDQEQRTLNPEQTEIFAGLDIPIEEYWEYRDNLYEFYDVRDALKDAAYADGATDEDVLRYTYINNIYGDIYDLYDKQKELASGKNKTELRKLQKQMEQMLSESKFGVDSMKLAGAYAEVGGVRYNKDADSGRWYEIKPKNADGSDNWYYQKEQEVTKGLGISYEAYWNNREEYNYAYDKPGRYAIAQAVGGYDSYREYYDALENWQSDNYIGADKDAQGNSISGSRKKKVLDYINGLDLDYGERIILYRTVYSSKSDKRTYNQQIIDYLNERDDISYQEMKSILEELDMVVDEKGYITW